MGDNETCHILTEESVTNVISALIVTAPTEDVKNVLRVYTYGKSTRNIEKEMHRFGVQQLQKTSSYLNIDDGVQYLKNELINNIICRIQNLLPEKCDICNEVYIMGNEDSILLPCEKCGQEFHQKCLFQILQICQKEKIDRQLVQKMINPFDLSSLRYLCKSCDEATIPLKGSARKKKSPAQEANDKTLSGESPTDAEAEQSSLSSLIAQNDPEVEATSEPNDQPDDDTEVAKKKVCRFYAKGTCTHGVSGKNCAFEHPKACPKLLKHGTKSPRGCNLGKKCQMFHPKMCPSSITKAECFDKDCKLKHVKGTKRSETSSTRPGSKQGANLFQSTSCNKKDAMMKESKNSGSKDFLEEVRFLKTGMEKMESQMQMLMSHMTQEYSKKQLVAPMGHSSTPQLAGPMSFPLSMMYPPLHQPFMQYPGMSMIHQQPQQQQQQQHQELPAMPPGNPFLNKH